MRYLLRFHRCFFKAEREIFKANAEKERLKLGAARLKYYSRLLKISCMMNGPQNAA